MGDVSSGVAVLFLPDSVLGKGLGSFQIEESQEKNKK